MFPCPLEVYKCFYLTILIRRVCRARQTTRYSHILNAIFISTSPLIPFILPFSEYCHTP